MARTRAGTNVTKLGRKAALLAAAVILTGCASGFPTAPDDDAGMHKWNGDPVVTTDQHYGSSSIATTTRTAASRP